MTIKKDLAVLKNLVELWEKAKPESTGANVVEYTGVVYNVVGSTDDPRIDGLAWKSLLIAYGINNDCYVDPSAAPGTSSHPNFNVGGHMTSNSTGNVPEGGSCYLMPLCAWHNNSARNGQAFSHVQTEMLQLTGYYQGEFAATFTARLPSSEPFSIIYETADGWQTKNLSAEHGAQVMAEDWPKDVFGSLPAHYVLLERQRSGMTTSHSLRAKQL